MVVHTGQTGTVAVLIDTPVWPWRGRRWSHLVSDVSYDELHAFVAAELGIPRRAFQGRPQRLPGGLHRRGGRRRRGAGRLARAARPPARGRPAGQEAPSA